MRFTRLVPALMLLFALAVPAAAEEPPAPRLDRVDHADLNGLVALGADLGAGQRTVGVARQLGAKGKTPRGTIQQIVRWVGRNLREDRANAGAWRTADRIVQDGTVGGQGDRVMMMGVMARAAGIPTTWVKGISIPWLKRARAGAAAGDAEPVRVFLEVYLEGAWRLVDPTTAQLYETYDIRGRWLPDDHLAYDRGGDPYALVLDNRGDLFLRQRDAFTRDFDVRRLPWGTSSDLLAPWRVYITGQTGPATYAREAARTLGFLVESRFDSNWDVNLAAARGKTLIVTSVGGEPNLPAAYRDPWLGAGWRRHYVGGGSGKTWMRHDLPDGTRVILVLVRDYGPVELAVSEALEG